MTEETSNMDESVEPDDITTFLPDNPSADQTAVDLGNQNKG